jgi:AraC family transcriptional regulator, regulatory protein of adaptative response / methylated-DNA-[protein]-cysteine methyltransferase
LKFEEERAICGFESKNRSAWLPRPRYHDANAGRTKDMTLVIEKPSKEKPRKDMAATPNERDPRWVAVANRDPAFDGAFVYSVKTTGVYCRPTCASRRAKPQNVIFHATWADAEKAGFRACRRCRPNEAARGALHAQVVAAACRTIAASEKPTGLDRLAAAAGMSAFHFHRVFKSVTGLTPKAYGAAHRAKRIRDQLSEGKSSVTEAIYDAGFNSNSRFYETSDEVLGMTSTVFRKGGANADIKFAVGECSLGSILVACSDKGVCAIMLGDDPDALVREIQDRFPNANLIGGNAAFEALVARVVGFVEAPRLGLDLPLDIRGSAFQQRVWQALREIPVGETASYAEIARRIGAPASARAVAHACADNKIAVAIPCHRVMRNDGALSGYRWGVARKRALLENEREG